MAFAHAFMVLVGVGAISVPILLHLLLRPRPREIRFPAVRFLKTRQRTNQRQLRWRHWMLLLLRCAILLLLALVLARPRLDSAALSTWVALALASVLTLTLAVCWLLTLGRPVPRWLTRTLGVAAIAGVLCTLGALVRIAQVGAGRVGFATQQAPVAAAWVIDTSPRMLYRQQGLTRLQRAQEMVRDLIGGFPAQSQHIVVDRPDANATFTQDASNLINHVRTLAVTGRTQPLHDTARRALQLLQTSQLESRELYLITDLTEAAWDAGDRDAFFAELRAAGDVRVHVLDCGVQQPDNNSIVALQPAHQRTTAGGEVELTAIVRHIGGPASCRVQWLLEQPGAGQPYVHDGQVRLPEADVRAQEEIKFDGPGEREVRWVATGLPPGVHHGRAQLIPADALAIDDEAHFSVEVAQGWQVAVITGPGAVGTFLTSALSDPSEAAGLTPRFACSVLDQHESLPDDWSAYNIVALLDPEPPTDAQWTAWNDYVTRGGQLVLFLGRNARAEGFNTPAAAPLMPGKLSRLWRTDGVVLQSSSDPHPTQRLFQRLATTVPWENMPVYRHWSLSDRPADAEISWWYSNRQPAIIERRVGLGRVVVMTTPISDPASDSGAWNLLPTGLDNWPFVVLIDQWFSYLAQQDHSPLNYLVGQPATIDVPASDRPVRFQLFTPRGEWREVAARGARIDVTLTDHPGTYRLRSTEPEAPARGFSVNLADDAGRLDRLDRSQLNEWLAATGAHLVDQSQPLERSVSEARVGVDFLGYLLSALAVLLLLEGLLAARFYPSAPTAGGDAAVASASVIAREMAQAARAGSEPVSVAPNQA